MAISCVFIHGVKLNRTSRWKGGQIEPCCVGQCLGRGRGDSQVASLCNRLPAMDTGEFKEEFVQVGPAGGGGGAQRATAARGKGADESAERAEGAGSPTLQTPGRTFLLRPAHRLAPARSVGHRLLAGPRRRQGWPWGTAGGRGWAWRRRRRVRAACPASPPCPAVPPPGSRPRSPTAARRAGRGAGVQRHAAGDVPGGDDQGHQRHQRARRQGPPAASPARSAARPPSRHPCPPPPLRSSPLPPASPSPARDAASKPRAQTRALEGA